MFRGLDNSIIINRLAVAFCEVSFAIKFAFDQHSVYSLQIFNEVHISLSGSSDSSELNVNVFRIENYVGSYHDHRLRGRLAPALC